MPVSGRAAGEVVELPRTGLRRGEGALGGLAAGLLLSGPGADELHSLQHREGLDCGEVKTGRLGAFPPPVSLLSGIARPAVAEDLPAEVRALPATNVVSGSRIDVAHDPSSIRRWPVADPK